MDQQGRLVRQLEAFRQRLLNLDTRNQSLFLRKIVKKRAYDLLRTDGEGPGEPAARRATAVREGPEAGDRAGATREGPEARASDAAAAGAVAASEGPGEPGGGAADPARVQDAVPSSDAAAPRSRPRAPPPPHVKRLWECLAQGSGRALLVPDSDVSKEADERRSGLRQLQRFATALREEKGLEETYVGLSWVEGFLDEHTFVRGPLVLVPCALEQARTGRSQGWYVTFDAEHPPEINTALAAAIAKLRGTEIGAEAGEKLEEAVEALPEKTGEALHGALCAFAASLGLPFDPAPFDGAPIEPLTKKDVAARERGRPKLRSHAVLGIFPQASSALFADFEEMIGRAQAGEIDQGIVDNLVDAAADAAPAPAGVDLDAVPDERINTVLPSDPSQDAVVVKAKDAKCLVVRGPPGTGKSQVIVNLIADALFRGERVLVCCQKRAALDVVDRRLREAGLTDAAFLVHDGERDRAALYKKMHGILQAGAGGADAAAESRRLAGKIDALVRELKEVAEPTWKEVHGERLFRLYARARPGFEPKGVADGVVGLDDHGLREACERIRRMREGAIRFDRGPLARRKSWADAGPLDRQEMGTCIDQLVTIEDPCLRPPDPPWIARAKALLPAYKELKGRWYRFLLPRWHSASRFVLDNGLDKLPQDEWLPALERGERAFALVEKLGRFFDKQMIWEGRGNLREQRAALDADFAAVQEYDGLKGKLSDGERATLQACLEKLGACDWADHVFQEATLRWIDEAERTYPGLKGDPRARYERLKAELAAALAEKRRAVAKEIATAVRHRQATPTFPPEAEVHPNRKAATDWNRLAYELGKKRRIKPLRALMRELSWPLQQVAPCWLASPEVVSEAFPLEKGLFDVVIFDEASQLDLERALPVLYRAKRAVIAGDEQQMPPTHWFEASRDEEEEGSGEEEEKGLLEAQRTDSLLVAAKRIYGFDYLSWHYRSRYQELIEYSNHAFYDGALQVAANMDRATARAAIEWMRVDGTWQQQSNPVEVARCVDLLRDLLAADRDAGRARSLGVITFNARQMDAVKDEIERRREEDADFAALWGAAEARGLDERPFVKNLENVQGDERDVIVLSVGYGPGPDGVFRKQFGVLNYEGGENFLNVAVTRAKERVIVVCSFEPEHLAVETSANVGPVRFKQYLLYSKAVGARQPEETRKILADVNPDLLVQKRAEGPRFESPFEEEVCRAIADHGYQVDAQVGLSGYRIDLAVIDPRDPQRYCMGIECDGATFHSGKSVRERDVSRQLFLESRGWKIHRVWSRHWWMDRQGEVAKVLANLPPVEPAETGPARSP